MFKTILWATDGSESADAALPYAKALAVQTGAALVVAHAGEYEIGAHGRFAGPVHVDEPELRTKIERQTTELKDAGLDVSAKVVGGTNVDAAHMIADLAREAGADVIVVGTRGHTALGGLLVGSVTQRLLHIATCPVLVVSPSVQPNG